LKDESRPKAAKSSSSNASLAEWTGLEPATPGVTGEYPRIAADGREQEALRNQ